MTKRIVHQLLPNSAKTDQAKVMKETAQGRAMLILCDEENLFQFAHSKNQLIINWEVPKTEEIYAKRIPHIKLLYFTINQT